MKITGGCHCGDIRYTANADPARTGVCHCTDCQRLSGAPFRASVQVDAAGFKIEQGEPKIYLKTAQGGNRRAQAFCGTCGAPIYASEAELPTTFNLRLGSVDQRDMFVPQRQVWCQSAQKWAQDVSSIPGLEQQN